MTTILEPTMTQRGGTGRPLGKSSLRLIGVEGFFRAEEFELGPGKSVIVGRSRRCGISIQRTSAYRESDPAQVHREECFRKVSREHFKISFLHPHLLEIENLSGNGTFVDGTRIDRVVLSDFRSHTYEISFGEGQKVRLAWIASGNGEAGLGP